MHLAWSFEVRDTYDGVSGSRKMIFYNKKKIKQKDILKIRNKNKVQYAHCEMVFFAHSIGDALKLC